MFEEGLLSHFPVERRDNEDALRLDTLGAAGEIHGLAGADRTDSTTSDTLLPIISATASTNRRRFELSR